MPSEALAAVHLSKSYGKRSALRGVSFQVGRGESVGYLGPNGAGKTTTLKLLSGLSRPTAGSVRVLGHDPSRDRDRVLSGVGALVETPGVPPYLTGGDLLNYFARVKGIPARERSEAVRRAAQPLVPLESLDRPFGTLSSGLARRVLLAASLVGDSEVLLLDEPTMGLDPVARHDLRAVLRELVRGGKTILLSTHLLEDVLEVCDRVLFLRDGVIVGDEPVRPSGNLGSNRTESTVRLRFAADLTPENVGRIAAPETRIVIEGPRQLLVHFVGGESEQAEIVARVVRSGVPLVSATPPEPDLARRYLEKVGREEAT